MKQVSIMVMAAILAIAIAGCADGTQSRASSEPGAVGSSSQTASEATGEEPSGQAASETAGEEPSSQAASEAAGEELSSQAGGESESPSAESEDAGSAESEKRKDPNYVLPDSDKVVYGTTELEELSDDELYYARNELFARHGAKFEDEDLSKHFNSMRWYRAIEPKLDEYGSGILNLVEATNAATLRRIELDRGSKHVNVLDPKRSEMYEAYLAKAEECQSRFGAAELANRDMHEGLAGLCLAQLVDFDGDDWEELLLAYHDASLAPEDDYFAPSTYRIEVWSCRDGDLRQDEQMGADSTQATSSYFMLCRAGEGYGFGSSGSQDGGLVYYYKLSQSNNPSSGDQYWYNESDISFDFDQMQTITEETLATLGARGGAAG